MMHQCDECGENCDIDDFRVCDHCIDGVERDAVRDAVDEERIRCLTAIRRIIEDTKDKASLAALALAVLAVGGLQDDE